MYQLPGLHGHNWYLALSSLVWDYLKSLPLDWAVMILQNWEPWQRLCLCHPALLCTRQSGCHSSNSKTSPCWGAAHWREANLILDITSVLIWAESFGPVFLKKSVNMNVSSKRILKIFLVSNKGLFPKKTCFNFAP